jgi:hypothetical protein
MGCFTGWGIEFIKICYLKICQKLFLFIFFSGRFYLSSTINFVQKFFKAQNEIGLTIARFMLFDDTQDELEINNEDVFQELVKLSNISGKYFTILCLTDEKF